MRAPGNEGRLGRRFLLAAGLIIAVVVPSAAFGGTARFYRECGDAHEEDATKIPRWRSSAGKGKRTNGSRP